MIQECKYNPERDIQKVDPTGYIDLVKANQTGSVPASIQADESRFNGIDDPASIGFRPRDQFEAMQANRAIVGYKPASSEATPPSTD